VFIEVLPRLLDQRELHVLTEQARRLPKKGLCGRWMPLTL
jgi:hypothetical protein